MNAENAARSLFIMIFYSTTLIVAVTASDIQGVAMRESVVWQVSGSVSAADGFSMEMVANTLDMFALNLASIKVNQQQQHTFEQWSEFDVRANFWSVDADVAF